MARDLQDVLGNNPRFLRRGQAFIGGYHASLHFLSVGEDEYQEEHTDGEWFEVIEEFMTSDLWPHYEDDWLEGFKAGYVAQSRMQFEMQLHLGAHDAE